MSIPGFLLVLAAAACHAAWNFFVKRINAGPELVFLFSVLSVVIYLPLAIWFATGWTDARPVQLLIIAGSAILHLGYFLLLQAGYRKGDLSLVYPTARATGPLLSTSFAVLFLGEVLSGQLVLGGGIIIFGIVMLTGGHAHRRGHAALSLAFGVSAGLLIGSYTVWDAYAVSVLAIPPLLLDYASSLGRSLLLAPIAYHKRTKVRSIWCHHKWAVVAIAILNPLAYILVLIALTFTPVVYVAPIRELSVLLTVLMGSILLQEGHLRHRLMWAVVILVGVIILALSD